MILAMIPAVEITSNVLGRSLHEDEFAEFWAEAERLAMPIFVHGMPSDLGGRVPAGLVPVAGFAVGADCALPGYPNTTTRRSGLAGGGHSRRPAIPQHAASADDFCFAMHGRTV